LDEAARERDETGEGAAAEPGPILPPEIDRAIGRVRRRIHRFLALDAALAGSGAAIAVGLPLALGLDLAGGPLAAAGVVAGLVGLGVAVREFRRRRLDGVRAAMVLDRLLGAKDRFASAVQFAAAEDPPPLHRLQIREASEFLDAWLANEGALPQAPRPRFRAPRFLVAALVTTGLAVPLHAAWFSIVDAVREIARHDEPPGTTEEIADQAEALRRRLDHDSTRRIDREINMLEHAFERAREREQRNRAEAVRRAAEAIERAAGIAPPVEENAGAGASSETPRRTAPGHDEIQDVSGAPPEQASQRLREAWAAAQRAQEAWRQTASRPESAPEEVARLQAAAQRALMEALRIAAQERSWRQARAAAVQGQPLDTDGDGRPNAVDRDGDRAPDGEERGTGGRPRDAGEELVRAIDRLDRAIGALDRDDDGVPGPPIGRALERASSELAEHTPETSRWLAEAARAREAGDANRMDRALERAREALRREAGRESLELAQAWRRLQQLRDQVAERAGQTAREQLALSEQRAHRGESGQRGEFGASGQGGQGASSPSGQGQLGQGQSGQGQSGQGQPGQGQPGQGQLGQGQSGQGQPGQGQSGQGQPGQGQSGQGQPGQGQSGQGQPGQGQLGQGQSGQGQSGQGQSGQGQSGQGQSGQGQSGQGQGDGQRPGQGQGDGQGGDGTGGGDGPTRGWGSGVAGDPGLAAAAAAAGVSAEGVNVDPGTDPEQAAQLGAEPDPMGLLPGRARSPGRGGVRMDGISGARAREGNGAVGGSGQDGLWVGGGTRVPGSLRAYVRRYLRALHESGASEEPRRAP
jgi:hypothetical protein